MTPASHTVAAPLRPSPPAWVAPLAVGDSFHCLHTRIVGATALDASALTAAVNDAYAFLARELRRVRGHALRVWNFVPQIQEPLGEGDRYMAFNAGRFAAYASWFGGVDALSSAVPTASAVGVGGDELWVHILAACSPGVPVENPRQTPSYRYSERYGLRPPCFARATRVGSMLLIGGTASILGEDSHHGGDIDAQTRETLANIAAVIDRARGGVDRSALTRLRDLRVHVLRAADAARVCAIVNELVPALDDIEVVQADLCRPELLVEIEGRAEL
jgi:chorismate lyase/3-hydroxybenzoate synthase